MRIRHPPSAIYTPSTPWSVLKALQNGHQTIATWLLTNLPRSPHFLLVTKCVQFVEEGRIPGKPPDCLGPFCCAIWLFVGPLIRPVCLLHFWVALGKISPQPPGLHGSTLPCRREKVPSSSEDCSIQARCKPVGNEVTIILNVAHGIGPRSPLEQKIAEEKPSVALWDYVRFIFRRCFLIRHWFFARVEALCVQVMHKSPWASKRRRSEPANKTGKQPILILIRHWFFWLWKCFIVDVSDRLRHSRGQFSNARDAGVKIGLVCVRPRGSLSRFSGVGLHWDLDAKVHFGRRRKGHHRSIKHTLGCSPWTLLRVSQNSAK